MSTALTAPARRLLSQTTTVRQFTRALWVALSALGLGVGLYLVEKYFLQPVSPFIESPADVMMRALALAHFLVGWLYLFTSPRLRNPRAMGRLLLVTVAGAGLCLLFAQFGATRNPFLVILFYGYFLIHEVGDETRLYQAYGDAPSSPAEMPRVLKAFQHAATVFLMTVLAIGYYSYTVLRGKETPLDRLPPAAFAVAGLLLLGCSLFFVIRALIIGLRVHGDLKSIAAAHGPLFFVYASILGVLLLGSALGSTGFNMIILIHVTAWLVFVPRQLGQRPRVPTCNPWHWLRATPAGFWTLHVGVALLVLVLMAVRVYAWQRVGFLSELLASSSFVYWGLMHISMAFWTSR